MIDPKELRLGNYVTEMGQVTEVDTRMLEHLLQRESGDEDLHSPILLSSDWCQKLGFHKTEMYKSSKHAEYNLNDVHLFAAYDLDFAGPSFSRNCRTIRYVHQLQNLYSALTGKELTLKEAR